MKLSEMQPIPKRPIKRQIPNPGAPRGSVRVYDYHQVDLVTGKDVKVWYSLKEIDASGEFTSQLVSKVCNSGPRTKHGGFSWRKVRKDSKKG